MQVTLEAGGEQEMECACANPSINPLPCVRLCEPRPPPHPTVCMSACVYVCPPKDV